MTELVKKAKEWAHKAHNSIGQTRKYTNEPYWVHTDDVSNILREAGESEEVQAAGDLHDVLEDVAPKNPDFSEENMRKEFGDTITNLVLEVTNVFTKEAYPHLNRAKRHALENKRLASISNNGQSIKYADIGSNVKGIFELDKGFGKKFVYEKTELLPMLKGGNPKLREFAKERVAAELLKFQNL